MDGFLCSRCLNDCINPTDMIYPVTIILVYRLVLIQNLSTVALKMATKFFSIFANYPVMFGRSTQSFRLLEHQNWSIISDSLGRYRML